MGRVLRLSLIAIALGCMVGCGGGASGGSSSTGTGGGSGGSGGTTPTPMLGTLSGQYAFMLTGYDSSGNPMAVAGSMTADGKGNITAGSADVTDYGVISSTTSLIGTYTLDSTLRGVITLTDTIGSLHPLIFAFTMKSNGTYGEIMGLDTNPLTIGGTIQQQTSSAFSLPNIAGSYVFELDSNAPNETKRQGTIGRFILASSGNTTGGLLDTSAVGTGVVSSSSAATVAFNGAPNATTGRGTLTITQNSVTTSYVYYIISNGKIFIIENDTGTSSTIRAGTAIGQTVPIPISANTAGSVFTLAGIDAAVSTSNNISAVGVLQVTSSSVGTLTWDSNDAGTLHGGTSGAITASNQTVTYDSTTGRGTITVSSGFSQGLFDSAVFYLAGPGQGFILDTTAGANNRALDGSLQLQTGVGSFSAASLPGSMIVRAVGNSAHNIGAVVGTFTPSSNVFIFTFDSRSLGTTGTAMNLVSSGDTIGGINANTGRGTLTIVPTTLLGNSITEIFYIIGQNQLAFVDVTTGAGNGPSPVFFFDPE